MKDKKYIRENTREISKNPRIYYDNYLSNIQDIFNKNYDKIKGIMITNPKNNKQSKGFENTKKIKRENNSIIHEKLGNFNLDLEKLKLNTAFPLDK